MKKVMATGIFVLVYGLMLAQDRAKDEVAINNQIDAMIYSWNNHSYDDLKNYTTEDTDWVNAVGMWWKGREESRYAHQVLHEHMFKKSVCQKKSTFIRFLTKDVALVHLYWHFEGAEVAPDGKQYDPSDGLAQLVFVYKNGKWLMTAGENTIVVDEAKQHDPVLQMPRN